MNRLNLLAEARIREWQAQKQRVQGRSRGTGSPIDSELPLEVSLLQQIVALRSRAALAPPAERQGLQQRAKALELQLLVLLETTGRPLAAQHLAEQLAKHSA